MAYRLRPPCWPRRATSRSIHLEPLTDLGHIGKPERQQIYPRCLYAYDVDALSQRWFAKILVFGRLRETHSSRNCEDTFLRLPHRRKTMVLSVGNQPPNSISAPRLSSQLQFKILYGRFEYFQYFLNCLATTLSSPLQEQCKVFLQVFSTLEEG